MERIVRIILDQHRGGQRIALYTPYSYSWFATLGHTTFLLVEFLILG